MHSRHGRNRGSASDEREIDSQVEGDVSKKTPAAESIEMMEMLKKIVA